MKANELMIGDWVISRKWEENPICITQLGKLIFGNFSSGNNVGPFLIEELEPIPITPEILEKNGFKTMEFYSELLYNDWQIMCDCSTVAARNKRGWSIDVPCCYVHELQHALRLCGVDKEIIL